MPITPFSGVRNSWLRAARCSGGMPAVGMGALIRGACLPRRDLTGRDRSRDSAAAQRAEDQQLVALGQREEDVAGRGLADEQPHVRANAILLVDDAELDTGEALVE